MLRNLGELALWGAQRYGDAVAFQVRRGFRMERLTFRQVGERARQVAGWLGRQGLAPGDRIVVWSPNMPEYAVLFFGAWLAGVVVVPIDVRTRPETIARFVATAQPRLAFRSRLLEGEFGPQVAATYILEELFDHAASAPPLAEPPPIGPDHLAEIVFTSGTTGMPKGVMLTHGNLLAEIAALRQAFPLRRTERALSLLPLSHAFEQVVNLLLAYSCGVRMTYLPRINAVTIVRALREERITCLAIVPELLRLLLAGLERRIQREGAWERYQRAQRLAERLPFPWRRPLFRSLHRALGGRLRFFGCGGAPLDLKLARTWERMGVRVFEGYGLTETCAGTTINSWRAQRLGSAGRPVPGVEVRIAADGEILVRGPTVTPGYYNQPELTAQAFTDGWLRTGDVGQLDADGFLYVSGRQAFKIVLPDGRNVYPEDIEQALNEHPLVRESCVVGLIRDGGETVHAVLLTDAPERAGEIVRETNRRLASHQQIMSYTTWSEEDFPRTPLLKIDRALVKEAVERQQTSAEGLTPAASSQAADPLTAIIARTSQRPVDEVREEAELGTDLGLDSLGRVELLSVIEEELGKAIDDARVGPQTTVGELRRMVAEEAPVAPWVGGARWPRTWWARLIGRFLLWIVFRIQDRWMQIEVVHPERAARLPFPSILIFNYQGPYVPLAMLRAIPPRLRSRVAIAVSDRLWRGRDRWQGPLVALGAQGFPFATSGGAVRPSLEELGRWLDDGYAVIISPEGGPEVDEQLRPFLPGAGLMAVEMQVPVVPFRVEQYGRLFPPDPPFPYLPNRRGRVRLIIGEPISFPKGTSYREATERMRQALLETR